MNVVIQKYSWCITLKKYILMIWGAISKNGISLSMVKVKIRKITYKFLKNAYARGIISRWILSGPHKGKIVKDWINTVFA